MNTIIVFCLFFSAVTSFTVYSQNFDGAITGWTKESLSTSPKAGWIQNTTAARSSNGFQIPPRAGQIIAVNDDLCGECNGEGDNLKSPPIIIPNEPMVALSFDIFYTGANGQQISVVFSVNGGPFQFALKQSIVSSQNWQTYRYPMYQFGGKTVQFKFKSFSSRVFISSGVALDNFLVEAFSTNVDTRLDWNFENEAIPAGWSRSSNSVGWVIGSSAERSSDFCVFPESDSVGTKFIAANDDQCFCDSDLDFLNSNAMIIPFGLTYGFLNFDYFFVPFTHSFYLQVSVNGGAFTTIYQAPELADSTFWEPFYLDLLPYQGKSIQFRYWSTDHQEEASGCVGVDDIMIKLYPFIEITSGAITSAKITSAAITSSAITSSEITSSEITSSEITSSEITSSEITSSAITSGTIGSCATWQWPNMNSQIGYFCSNGNAFWMCMKGPHAPQSRRLRCATGTRCRCNEGVECSTHGSPCTF